MDYQSRNRHLSAHNKNKGSRPVFASESRKLINNCNNKWALVTMNNGEKYYGIISFFDYKNTGQFKFTLDMSLKVPKNPLDPTVQKERIVISENEYQSIELLVETQNEKRRSSINNNTEKEVVPRNDTVPVDTLENLSSKIQSNTLVNKFKSNFNEDLYSIALNKEMVNIYGAEAEIKANNINSEKTANFHLAQERNQVSLSDNMDEEKNYSSVVLGNLNSEKVIENVTNSSNSNSIWNTDIPEISHNVRSMLTLKIKSPNTTRLPTTIHALPPPPHTYQILPGPITPFIRPMCIGNDIHKFPQPGLNQLNQQYPFHQN